MNNQNDEKTEHIEIVTLHFHWLYADSVRVRIRKEIVNVKEKKKGEKLEQTLQELLNFGETQSIFLAMSVWYALLYVVIEGYRETGLRNEHIDRLLAREEYVDLLRRFRNAVFHYQQEPLSEKLLGFLVMEDSENWIRELNYAFNAFFEAYPPLNKFLNLFKSE